MIILICIYNNNSPCDYRGFQVGWGNASECKVTQDYNLCMSNFTLWSIPSTYLNYYTDCNYKVDFAILKLTKSLHGWIYKLYNTDFLLFRDKVRSPQHCIAHGMLQYVGGTTLMERYNSCPFFTRCMVLAVLFSVSPISHVGVRVWSILLRFHAFPIPQMSKQSNLDSIYSYSGYKRHCSSRANSTGLFQFGSKCLVVCKPCNSWVPKSSSVSSLWHYMLCYFTDSR